MFKQLRDWLFKPTPQRQPAPIDNWASLLAQICPDCKDHPVKLLEGPSSGMSTNVFCSNCGHGYNISPALSRADDIGVNLDYCQNDQVKAPSRSGEAVQP